MGNAFFENIKKDIVERLECNIGRREYLGNLGFSITRNERSTGIWHRSTKKAKNEIFKYWDEFGAAAKHMRDNLGITTNPIIDCELFHCQAMTRIYERAFNTAVSDFEEWDTEIEITAEFIGRVKEALESVYFDDIF